MFVLCMFVLIVFMLGVFLPGMLFAIVVGMSLFGVFVFAMRIGMFGALLSDVRGEFRAVDGAGCFDFRGFFFGESRDWLGRNYIVFLSFLFRFVLFENGAACESIGFRSCGGFFVFGFDEISGQRCNLIFTQVGFAVNGYRFLDGRSLRCFGCLLGRCG
jgi:hypothetical protein